MPFQGKKTIKENITVTSNSNFELLRFQHYASEHPDHWSCWLHVRQSRNALHLIINKYAEAAPS